MAFAIGNTGTNPCPSEPCAGTEPAEDVSTRDIWTVSSAQIFRIGAERKRLLEEAFYDPIDSMSGNVLPEALVQVTHADDQME